MLNNRSISTALLILTGVFSLGFSACNKATEEPSEAVAPQIQQEAPKKSEMGCESQDLNKDPLCKFVVTSSETFTLFMGQNIKAITHYEYDKKGRVTAMRMALPATPDKYFATVAYSISEVDGLKHGEEWMLDYNFDGKFDYRTTQTTDYSNEKIADEATLTYDLSSNNVVITRAKKYDYTVAKQLTTTDTTEMLFNNNGDKFVKVEVQANDDQQRMIKSTVYETNWAISSDPIKITETKNTYNDQNLVLKADQTVGFQSKLGGNIFIGIATKIENTYDAQNHLSEINSTTDTIGVISQFDISQFDETRSYDAVGNLALQKQEWDNNNDGTADTAAEWKYTYDENNNNTALTITSGGAMTENQNRYERLYKALNSDEPEVAQN